jgi:hypothetical protein
MGFDLVMDQGPSCVMWTNTFFPYGAELLLSPAREHLVLRELPPAGIGQLATLTAAVNFARAPPNIAIRRSGTGGRRGVRRLRTDHLLRRHQDPQDRVDQDLAAGDKHEQQHEEDSRGPRFNAEASAETGAHAAQYPPLARSDQTLLGEAVVDVVHVDGALLQIGTRGVSPTPLLCAARDVWHIRHGPDLTPESLA